MANPVGGNTAVITPPIVVSTSPAYAANDVVGGKIEIQKAFRQEGDSALLQSIFLTDEAAQALVLEILLFEQNPSATYTDNLVLPDLSTDVAKLVGRIPIVAADWVTQGTVGSALVANLGLSLDGFKALTSLWMVMVVTSTPTFAATSDLRVLLGFLQD